MKKITFYASFDAQKQHEVEEILKTSPLERIKQVVELIRKVYNVKEKSEGIVKRINFVDLTQ